MKNKVNFIANYLLLFGVIGYLLYVIVYSLFFNPVGPDSGYYLQAIEYTKDGLMPYADFRFGYPPGLFLLAPIKSVLNVSYNYVFDMSFIWIIELLCSYLTYIIGIRIGINRRLSIIASLLFLIISSVAGGMSFLLEMPSLLFGMLAILICLNRSKNIAAYVAAGATAAMALMFKQYGLGFLVLCAYILMLSKEKVFSKVLMFLLGYMLMIVIAYCIFGKYFIDLFFGNTYKGFDDVDSSIAYKFLLYCKIYFKKLVPSLLFVPILFFFVGKDKIKSELFNLSILIFAFLGFSLQFYFGGFAHYAIYTLPFIALLFVWLIQNISSTYLKTTWILLVLLNVSYIVVNVVYHSYIGKTRKQEEMLSANVKKSVVEGKTVLIYDNDLISQYYISDLMPPLLNKYGLGFGNESTERIQEQGKVADYILKDKESAVFTDNIIDSLKFASKIDVSEKHELLIKQ